MKARDEIERDDSLITVDTLRFDGPAGPVFRLGPVEIPRAALTVVYGPAGSGRSSALLALAGRLTKITGTGRFDRLDLIKDTRRIRQRVAVARITGLVDLESRLTVSESIFERALTEGVPADAADRAVAHVEELAERRIDRTALVETLSGRDRALLTIALGHVRAADLIVIDDIDAGLADEDRAWFCELLDLIASSGPAIVATALSPAGVPPSAALISLEPTAADAPPKPPPVRTAEEN